MKKESSSGKILRIGGILTVLISLITGTVFVLTIGKSCGFIGGLGIMVLFLLTLAGIIAFISGLVIQRRERTTGK